MIELTRAPIITILPILNLAVRKMQLNTVTEVKVASLVPSSQNKNEPTMVDRGRRIVFYTSEYGSKIFDNNGIHWIMQLKKFRDIFKWVNQYRAPMYFRSNAN